MQYFESVQPTFSITKYQAQVHFSIFVYSNI